MKQNILAIIGILAVLYPIVHAMAIGYEYNDLIKDIITSALTIFFSLTISDLLKRVDDLERKNAEHDKKQESNKK